MFDYSNFARDILGLIVSLLKVYLWVVIIRVLLSWINLNPYNPIVQFLRGITDPVIEGLRRFVPRLLWTTGIDFTPLILIIVLQVIIILLTNIRL